MDIQIISIPDSVVFPNSRLPVIFYKAVLNIPFLFPALYIKNLFSKNDWVNSWDDGILTYQHYHSTTHEVLGFYKGSTTILLGGRNGIEVMVKKGDVLIIPAGVAHKNLGLESDASCVGAYPEGMNYDMNYGKTSERPDVDKNIKKVTLPTTDPVFGEMKNLKKYWTI